jgi:predicted anti-sigma-YlaC factor YlaD
MYKRICTASLVLVLSVCFFACTSVKKAAVNSVSDGLSGYTKNGKPVKKSKADLETNPMIALTGESDVRLVADFFPTALKMYDIMHFQNPSHMGLSVMTGSLYVMYANAFVQADAEKLPVSQFDVQNSEFERAKKHYLRGRDYILDAFSIRHPGFKENITSGNPEKIALAVKKITSDDVNAVYWMGAGWLGAFSLDPLNFDLLMTIGGAVQALEAAAAFDPNYSGGAIWDILCAFYAAAPADVGGDPERAEFCYSESLRASGGKLPGPYVTYAQSLCIPRQDVKGFTDLLTTALAINPDDTPESRLAVTITLQKAQYLLDNKDNYFIEW